MLNKTNLLLSVADQGTDSAQMSFHISPLIAIIISVILTALGIFSFYYFWEKTHRPKQLKNKNPTPGYSSIVRRALRYLFSEDKSYLGSAKDKGFLPWRYFNYGAVLFSYAFFPLSSLLGIPIWFAPIPLVFTIIILTGRFRAIYATQENIVSRIYQIAKTNFKYPNAQDINPWDCVKVESWIDEATPKRVVISLPPTFNGTFSGSTEGFEGHFNSATSIDAAYRYEWNSAEGNVICEYAEPIPKMANYPGSEHSPWNEFPLGLGRDGEVVWNVLEDPHMLIAGPTGSGKSVAQRNVIVHCLQHSDMWEFIGIDVKRVELSPYQNYIGVRGIALDKEEGVEALQLASTIMDQRYEQLMAAGLNSFTALPVVPKAIMIMIDEAFEFMSPAAGKTEEAKQETALAEEATFLVGRIARLGRAAGVHMVIAMQRPDAKVLFGEIKNNFTARYAAGPMKATPSTMLMDNTVATTIQPGIKGRAVVIFNTGTHHLQTYYTSEHWIDEWIASKKAKKEAEKEGSQGGQKDDGSSMYRKFEGSTTQTEFGSGDRTESISIDRKKGLKNIIKAALAEFKDPDGTDNNNEQVKNKVNKSAPTNKRTEPSSSSKSESQLPLPQEEEIGDSYTSWEDEYSSFTSKTDEEKAALINAQNPKSNKGASDNNKATYDIDETPITDISHRDIEEEEETTSDISFSRYAQMDSTNTPSDIYEEDAPFDIDALLEDPPANETDAEENPDTEEVVSTNKEPSNKELNYDEWDDDLEKLFANMDHNVPKKVAESKYKPTENSKFSGAFDDMTSAPNYPEDEGVLEPDNDSEPTMEAVFEDAFEKEPPTLPVLVTKNDSVTHFDGVINELDNSPLGESSQDKPDDEFDDLSHLTSLFNEDEEEEEDENEISDLSLRVEPQVEELKFEEPNISDIIANEDQKEQPAQTAHRAKSRHLSAEAAAVFQEAMKTGKLNDETWTKINEIEAKNDNGGLNNTDSTPTPQSLTNQIVRPSSKKNKVSRPQFTSKMNALLDEEKQDDTDKINIKRPIRRPGR